MQTGQSSHAELVRQVAGGDVQAFQVLFQVFAPRVQAWLHQALGPSQAAEVTQEVLVRVWRGAGRYNPERGAVSTWIFTIARNAKVDALRATRFAVDPDDPTYVSAPTPTPEVQVSEAQRDRMLRKAVQDLPDEQGLVLRGAYFDGLSLKEIAENQSLPLGTVKSRVRLALDRLRERMSSWTETP